MVSFGWISSQHYSVGGLIHCDLVGQTWMSRREISYNKSKYRIILCLAANRVTITKLSLVLFSQTLRVDNFVNLIL